MKFMGMGTTEEEQECWRVVQGVKGFGVKEGTGPTYGLYRLSEKGRDGVASRSWWVWWLEPPRKNKKTGKWSELAVSSTWFEFARGLWGYFVWYCYECYMMFATDTMWKRNEWFLQLILISFWVGYTTEFFVLYVWSGYFWFWYRIEWYILLWKLRCIQCCV